MFGKGWCVKATYLDPSLQIRTFGFFRGKEEAEQCVLTLAARDDVQEAVTVWNNSREEKKQHADTNG